MLLSNMKGHVLNTGMARLIEAICDGRIYQTRQLLESGTNVSFVDEEGLTPLMRAAQLPHQKCRTRQNLLKLLLQYGANVNTVDKKGRHVLSQACRDGKEDIVRLLCNVAKQDVDLNLRDFEGNTPLMHSVRTGNAGLVKFILKELKEFQVDIQAIDVRNNEDRTPYLEAKLQGYEECANILLTEGNASTNIQVNPFLEFISEKDECSYKGKVRGLDDNKYTSIDSKTTHFNPLTTQKKKSGSLKKPDHLAPEKSASLKPEKILKRKTCSPRKLSRLNFVKEEAKNEEKQRRRRKYAWDEGVDAREKTLYRSRTDGSEKEFDMVSTELSQPAEIISAPVLFSSSQAKTSLDYNKERPTIFNHDLPLSRSNDLSTSSEPSSGEFIRAERRERPENERPKSTMLRPLPADFGRKSSEPSISSRKQFRSTQRTETNAKDDVCSWYSHFSVYNSTSVAFLTKIMNLYAEQVSPDSSFRSGVKPINPDEPKVPEISVVTALGDESGGDSGRLSPTRPALSTRSNSANGTGASRKTSPVVTRTVNAYLPSRRTLSTLRVQDIDN